MLTGVEWFLTDYSKKPSGSAMEGTLDPGDEIWTSGQRGLRWVDHRLRTVVIDGDENEQARKDKPMKGLVSNIPGIWFNI